MNKLAKVAISDAKEEGGGGASVLSPASRRALSEKRSHCVERVVVGV